MSKDGISIINLHDLEFKSNVILKSLKKIKKIIKSFYWKHRFAYFGTNSSIDKTLFLNGLKSIRIGNNVKIWKFARIEALGNGNEIIITIGDGSTIHPFFHIGAAKKITIGKGVLIASRVFISDHDHDFSNPLDPVVSNGRLLASSVTIGDFVWLGEGAMVLKGVTIGEHSIIGAGSVVAKDIPAYSIAVGNPAKIISQYDKDKKEWIKMNSSKDTLWKN